MESIWWEKTVEYKFILDAAREKGLQFAAPLAGVQEQGGDGVFSSDSKIILVEFKRSEDELKTEFDKFTRYSEANEKLGNKDGHHFLVYGACDSGQRELTLDACTYFSRSFPDSVLEILDQGLSPLEFRDYLAELLALKKGDGRSSGTIGPESVASAIGVSPRGGSSVSLSEYYRIALPELYQATKPTQTDEPPPLRYR